MYAISNCISWQDIAGIVFIQNEQSNEMVALDEEFDRAIWLKMIKNDATIEEIIREMCTMCNDVEMITSDLKNLLSELAAVGVLAYGNA